jgi:hypothetical protein
MVVGLTKPQSGVRAGDHNAKLDGQVGLCRLFAGNGWFDCGTDSSLRITGDLTVMAWVNRRSSIVNGQICAKGSGDDYTHMYLFQHDKMRSEGG